MGVKGMPQVRTLGPFFALAVSLCLPGAQLGAAEELQKLHVVLVFDTKSDLKKQLVVDKRRIENLLKQNIPGKRFQTTTFTGSQVTRAKILAHLKGLKVGSNEGLLFFYGGHGALDPKTRGHYFQLQDGKKGAELFRSDVLAAMRGTGAPLRVLLTDCCSSSLSTRAQPKLDVKTVARGTLHPTLRNLLFEARGEVDITAASPGTPSWGDDEQGGLFTRSLCKALLAPRDSLDLDRDGNVTWEEFFPVLRYQTEVTFKNWSDFWKKRGEGDAIDQDSQVPVSPSLRYTYGVISIINRASKPLTYRYRWTGQTEWRKKTLKSGEKIVHSLPLVGSKQEEARFEIQVEKAPRPSQYAPARWTGAGEPDFEVGKLFNWNPKPKKP
jgi:hypothetical protein